MAKKALFYRTITPLHMGVDNVLGLVDLPIQREKHTNLPKMEASGIKGVYRALFEKNCKDDDKIGMNTITKWFGAGMEEVKDDGVQNGKAGDIIFYDAKLLLFPVKANKDFFVWVTCPYVLSQFIENTGMWKDCYDAIRKIELKDGEALQLCEKAEKNIIIGDYCFNSSNPENIILPFEDLYDETSKSINEKLEKNVYIVDNETFSYFCEMNTEIHTRIKIGENGVVEVGALFTEEFLPEHCFFYQQIDDFDNKSSEDFIKELHKKNYEVIQFGGDSTIGKGLTKLIDPSIKESGGKCANSN